MLGIDRTAARVTWTVFLILLAIGMTYAALHAILLFILAIFFAYMLAPIVEYLDQWTPRRLSRRLSLAVVYTALIALLILGGTSFGSKLSEQGTALLTRLPDLLKSQSLESRALPSWLEPYRARIIDAIRVQTESGLHQIVPMLQSFGVRIATLAGGVLFFVLVPILSFFFLKDAREMRLSLLGFFYGSPNQAALEEVLDDLHLLLGKYIRALVTLSGATFVFYFIFLEVTQVPYSALLAAIAAPLEFIPVLGPLTASVIILLVAAFSGYPHLLWIVVFLGIYRIFQDYILAPFLMSEGVELHPLLVIFGVLAGEEIGGVWGMFLSVPFLAAMRVILVRFQKGRQLV
jgi:predicted PurR-regulated permease PerM